MAVVRFELNKLKMILNRELPAQTRTLESKLIALEVVGFHESSCRTVWERLRRERSCGNAHRK